MMMTWLLKALAVAAVLGAVPGIDAGRSKVHIDDLESQGTVVQYLSRFSYLQAEGKYKGFFSATVVQTDPKGSNKDLQGNIILADQESYDEMCKSEKLCEKTDDLNKTCATLYEWVSSLEDGIGLYPITVARDSPVEVTKEIVQHETQLWYAFYIACDFKGNTSDLTATFENPGPYDVYVNIKHENLGRGWLEYQFSSEHTGLNLLYLLFWLATSALLGYVLFVQRRNSHNLVGMFGSHRVTRLFTAVVILQWINYFCSFCYYATYANTGTGPTGFLGIGNFLGTVSTCGLILLVLVLAKGWTVTSSELRGAKTTLVAVAVVSVLYLSLFIVKETDFSSKSSSPDTYIISYQTWAGILICIGRVLLGLYFLWEVRSTYMMEDGEAQLRFYQIFAGGYFLWIISVPFFVAVGAICDYTVREKVVEVTLSLCNLKAIAVMAFLLRPRENEFFRLNTEDVGAGDSALPYDSI